MTLWQKTVAFGFRLLYNEFAWTYDIVSWLVSLGHWRKWQLAALDHVQGERVLEIAHGPGHMLAELHKRGFQVWGCDLSVAMGRIAHGRLRRANLAQQVPLFRCRIPQFPMKEGTFNTVLSQFPTAFIAEEETLTAVYKLLADNGRLVILPEGHLTSEGLLYRFITWLFVITGQQKAGQIKQRGTAVPTAETMGIWGALLSRLEQVGFAHVEVKAVQLEGSIATVVIAKKGSHIAQNPVDTTLTTP